jgi:PAS domain S-box-containing protein
VMIVGLDAAGRVRMFNHAAEKITGYTIEELTGINWFEKIVPQDRYAYVWETFQNYQQKTGAMPTTFENPILTKSGEERFISWQNSTISTPGAEISTISFGVDITERKRAEEALRKSEERLRLEVARMPIGYIVWDKDFRVVTWNPAAEKIFGFTFDEVKGRHPYETIVPPEAQSHVDDIWRRLLAGDASAHSVNENQTKDGCTIICDWTNTPLKQPEGTVLGVMSMVQDITERKRAEAALRESEKRLRELNVLQGLLLPPNPIEQKLKLVTEAVVWIVGADFARIWMIKPSDRCEAGCIHAQVAEGPHTCRLRDRCLHLMASSGRYTHTDGRDHRRVPLGCYKIGKLAAGEEPKFLTNDVTTDPRVHNHTWAKELGLVV